MMTSHAAWDRVTAVATRQAFGLGFEPSSTDADAYQRISDGRIVLPPHPQWQFTGVSPDWHADPFEQRNWCAQLHMLRWLDPLRRTNDGPAYAELWARHVRNWIEHNDVPEETTRWAWKDMVDAIRAEVLLYGATLFDEPQPWLVRALELHGHWLADERNLGHSNHALHQHAALFQIAAALGTDVWRGVALTRLEGYFADGYDSEGVNVEGAPGYWELNLRWAREVARRVEREGSDAGFVHAATARSAEAIAHSTRPDGKLEAIGDTVAARPAGVVHPALEYVVSSGATGTPPVETTKVYSAGYAFGRTGWGETQRAPNDETFYSLLFGRADKVHGHQDGGSITYFANGNPFLTEAGKYSYTTSQGRVYAVGRAGHNVPVVSGRRYDPRSDVELLVHRSTSRYDYFKLRDRGYDGIDLVRQVVFAKLTESLLVIDTTRARRPVEVETRWHLQPGTEAARTRGVINARTSTAEFSVAFGGRLPEVTITRGSTEPFEGWVSPCWHQLEATNLIKAVQGGTSFRTVCAIQRVADDRERLESRVVDGCQGFVVRGTSGSEFISIAADIVDVRRIDPSTGLVEGPEGAGSNSGPEHLRLVEQSVKQARSEMSTGAVQEETVARLRRTYAAGTDHGVAAALADAAALSGSVDELVLPHGTRRGFILVGRSERSFPEGVLPTYGYPTVTDLSRLPDEPEAVLLVGAGSLVLPVRFSRGDEPELIVGFTGALDRVRESLPRFERLRSLRGRGPSVLVFSDPTLDLATDLGLAWYLGTSSEDLAPRVGEVIRTVADDLGARNSLLLGTSGGGFGALQASAYAPEASVLAINPQTDVRQYHERFARAALTAVFGSVEDVDDVSRVCVMDRFAREGCPSKRVLYVSNTGDGHHSRHHAEPFREWCAKAQPGFELDFREVDWGRGHIGPSPTQFEELLAQARRP